MASRVPEVITLLISFVAGTLSCLRRMQARESAVSLRNSRSALNAPDLLRPKGGSDLAAHSSKFNAPRALGNPSRPPGCLIRLANTKNRPMSNIRPFPWSSSRRHAGFAAGLVRQPGHAALPWLVGRLECYLFLQLPALTNAGTTADGLPAPAFRPLARNRMPVPDRASKNENTRP